MTDQCQHPKKLLRPAMLQENAKYCSGCSSLVFKDGHTEPVAITRITTSKR